MEQLPVVRRVNPLPLWKRYEILSLLELLSSFGALLMLIVCPFINMLELLLECVLYFYPVRVMLQLLFDMATHCDSAAAWLKAGGPHVMPLGGQQQPACSARSVAEAPAAGSGTRRFAVPAKQQAEGTHRATASRPFASPSSGLDTGRAGSDQATHMQQQQWQASVAVALEEGQEEAAAAAAAAREGQLSASAVLQTLLQWCSKLLQLPQQVLRHVYWMAYTNRAQQLASSLVCKEQGSGAALAVVIAAEAVANEACTVAVFAGAAADTVEPASEGDSIDRILDAQLADVQSAVQTAAERVWAVEGEDVARTAAIGVRQQGAAATAETSERSTAASSAAAEATMYAVPYSSTEIESFPSILSQPSQQATATELFGQRPAAAPAATADPAADNGADQRAGWKSHVVAAAVAARDAAAAAAQGAGRMPHATTTGILSALRKALFFLCLLKALGVHLSSCFNLACRQVYRRRIRLADVLVHGSILFAMLLFTGFVIIARYKERYYAEGVGMCLGRCGGRADCWNNITLQLPLFDDNPSCPGEGRVNTSKLLYHQCPAVLMVLQVSDISMDNRTVTTAPAAGSSAGGVSKLTENAAAAAAAADQLGIPGTSGRRLQSGCSCEGTSPSPPAAAASMQQGGSSSSSPSPGAAGSADDQPGDRQYVSPAPEGTQPGTAAAGSPALDAFASPGTPTGDGTSSNTGSSSSSSSSPSLAAGQNKGALGDTQPSPSPADVAPTITNSPSPGVLSTPPTGDTAAAAYSPSPAGVSTATRDAGGGASPSPSPSSSPSPSPGAIIERGVLPTAGQDTAAVTSCTAKITLLDSSSSAPAKEGVSVTAVWYTMFGGRNVLNDKGGPMQNATVVTAKTGAKGIAVFTSPPINASSGYGCNITILQPSDGSYELDEKGSTKLWDMTVW
jgi:hypothetical protein